MPNYFDDLGEIDFDSFEFEDEDEIEEYEKGLDDDDYTPLSPLYRLAGKLYTKNDLKTAVLNPRRYAEFDFVHKVLEYLAKSNGGVVTYKLNDPFKESGSISIEGSNLVFTSSKWFARIAEFANNMEAYPLDNGNVRITFGFHNMVEPIE